VNEEKSLEIKQLLRSNNPKDRIIALEKLALRQTGVDEIASLLLDSNEKVRERAAKALGMVKPDLINESHKNFLLTAIEDPSDKVCSTAIYTIGKLRIEEARERLLPFLEDKNPFVVNSTIFALGQFGPSEIGEKIIGFLERKNVFIQLTTITALGNLNYERAGQILLEKLKELMTQGIGKNDKLVRNYVITLGKLNYSPAIPYLIDIAQNFIGARSKAINALIEMNAEEAVPILIPLLADPGVRLRDSLIKLMLKTNFSATTLLIRPMINDHNAEIRSLVVTILSKEKDFQSLESIKKIAYSDSSPFVRIAALNALCEWLEDDGIDILINLVKDTNTVIRRLVTEKLGSFEYLPNEGIDAVRGLANDDVEEIQIMAKNILERNNEKPFISKKNRLISHDQVVPNKILKDRQKILEYLHLWQNELPILLESNNTDKISGMDNALSILIYHLENPCK